MPTPSEPNYDIPMTNLQPLKIGPYDVQPMYEEELADGHFNIKITGGDVAAVREWVGPEDASGVVVVRTEIENDYHHGHVEMPDPIPADARLWIEIETPDGERLKGSVPLQ
jgi:catechol 2,3-dioxygenase-like lactoylglutathione lyase family enzyme